MSRALVSMFFGTAAVGMLGCPPSPSPGVVEDGGGAQRDGGIGDAPVVHVLQPAPDDVYAYGTPVVVRGSVEEGRGMPWTLSIRWRSDLDGTLNTSPADRDGALTFTMDAPTPGRHVLVVSATDESGRSAEDSVVFTVLPSPDAPVVTIAPADPTTQDTLVAVIEPAPSAADLAYTVEWRRNGERVDTPTNRVEASQTTRGEAWSVLVVGRRPGYQSPPGTARVTIVNAAPVCRSAVFVPAEGNTSTSFVCACADRFEPDPGDAEVDACAVLVNGVALSAEAACRVDADLTQRGDALDCTLTPGDGETAGAPVSAPTVVVSNTPPQVGAVTLSSDGCGRFTCVASGLADLDSVDVPALAAAFRWSRNGTFLADTGAVLEANGLQQGDTLTCHARATDGATLPGGTPVYGPEVASEPLVVNERLPSVASATLIPANPVVGEQLECVPAGFDAAGCAWLPRYGYEWFVDGQRVDEATSATFLPGEGSAGLTVSCRVTTMSGVGPGTSVESNVVTLGTRDERVPLVAIEAVEGADGPVTCAVRSAGTVSLDGATWHWRINDAEPFAGGTTLGAAAITGCDRVRCWVQLAGDGAALLSNVADTLLPRGSACAQDDACRASECDPAGGCRYFDAAGVSCVAGVGACQSAGTCVGGTCSGGGVTCDDHDPCTADACNPVTGCSFAPVSGPSCDDGDACTTGDACTAGECRGRRSCSCNADGDCDDRNPCTTEQCVGGACAYADSSAACDDGDACTTGDHCQAGACGGSATACTTYFLDLDGDTYGGTESVCTCIPVPGFTASRGGDCNDADASIHPGANELPGDGQDSNCDAAETCFVDADRDGFRSEATIASTTGVSCRGVGEITASAPLDCNDANPAIHPAAAELPGDGMDSNCDGRERCFVDSDSDHFRSDSVEEGTDLACTGPFHAPASARADCDDTRSDVHPNAVEVSDDGIDSDCDGRELFNNNLLDLAGPLVGSTYDVHVSGPFDMGALGVVQVEGRLQRSEAALSWCVWTNVTRTIGVLEIVDARAQVCMNELAQIVGTLDGAGTVAGHPVQLDGSFSLFPPFDYHLGISGEVNVGGTPLPSLVGASFVESVGGVQAWQVSLSAGTVTLATGVVLRSAVYVLDATGMSIRAEAQFGVGQQAVNLLATGAYSFDGDYALTLGLAPGAAWDPFAPVLPVRFSALGGSIVRTGATVTATLMGEIEGSLTVVPGLVLTGASASGTVDSGGYWKVELSGSTSVDFGDGVDRGLRVIGSLDSEAVFTLAGEMTGTLEPLADLIGPDRFVVEGDDVQPLAITFTAKASAPTSVSLAIDAPMHFCVFGGCLPSEELTALIHAEGIIDNGFTGYFRATLGNLALPGFPVALDNVAFAASTGHIEGVDMFGDGSVIRDLERGITMAVHAECPIPLEGLADPPLFVFGLQGPTRLHVEADLGITLPIIKREHNFPTIAEATMTRVFFLADIIPGIMEMGLGSEVLFQPDNQPEPLLGSVQFTVSTSLSASGEMKLLGRWKEPFALRDFAVQNPGFTLAVNFSSSVPVPESLGWNFDVYWRKDKTLEWPTQLPPEVTTTPAHVLAVGSTFYFDAIPSESGFCFVGACVPMSPLVFRFRLENLRLDDVVTFANDVNRALVSPLAVLFTDPPSEVEPLDVSPNTVDVHVMRMAASTHTFTFLGQPLVAGIHVNLETTVNGVDTDFEGSFDPDGLFVRGEQDGISVPGFALVGDPLWHDLVPAGGWVEVPDDPLLLPARGTLEGWVNAGTWSTSGLDAELAAKVDVNNGFVLGVGDAAGGLGRVMLLVRNGGETRTLRSEPLVRAGVDTHIAWMFDGAAMGLYADGNRLTVEDSGPVMAVGRSSEPLQLGRGMDRVDDVRIWNVLRTPTELAGQARSLPLRFINQHGDGYPGSPLVARYEFDWDRAASVAHNTRVGHALDGAYVGGARAQFRVADNPTQLLIDLTNPLATGRLPGFGIAAGLQLSIPAIPNGDLTWALFAKMSVGSVAMKFYSSDFELLPLGLESNGSYIGSFWVGGLGPNMVDNAGGLDDGVYGDFDLNEVHFAGSSRFEFVNKNGDEQRYAEGALIYDDPTDYLYVDGSIDLLADFGGGTFGVTGFARYNAEGAPPYTLIVDGAVEVHGKRFTGVNLVIDSTRATFTSGWRSDVPPPPFLPPGAPSIVGTETAYEINFVNGTFCGTTQMTISTWDCSVGVCFHPEGQPPTYTGVCDGMPLCGNGVCEPGYGEVCGAADSGFQCVSDCGKCADGTACLDGSVCESGICNAGACSAGNLPLNSICTVNEACRSGSCTGVCSPVCGDGTCEQEMCGGSDTLGKCNSDCGKCPRDYACLDNADCISGVCNLGFCIAGDLPVGAVCTSSAACSSSSCVAGICAPVCGDGVCEGTEICSTCTSDCGKCPNNVPCDANSDCQSGLCNGLCIPSKLAAGSPCTSNSVCRSDVCAGVCIQRCGDGYCDGTEGCGSGNTFPTCQADCGKCSNGSTCDAAADCRSNLCYALTCCGARGTGASCSSNSQCCSRVCTILARCL